MRIGVVSDTHGYLDPGLPACLAGVEHILHAGDIGSPALLAQLAAIAPVTAVLGNTDEGLNLPETAAVTLGGVTFLVHHIVEPGRLQPALAQQVAAAQAGVIVFGHTHKPFAQRLGELFYLNPGYAGRQRFRLERSAAILDLRKGEIRPEFVRL